MSMIESCSRRIICVYLAPTVAFVAEGLFPSVTKSTNVEAKMKTGDDFSRTRHSISFAEDHGCCTSCISLRFSFKIVENRNWRNELDIGMSVKSVQRQAVGHRNAFWSLECA